MSPANGTMTPTFRLVHFENGKWQCEITKLDEICGKCDQLKGCFLVYISLPAKMDLTTTDQQLLSRTFDIPSSTLSPQSQKATGFFFADHRKSANAEIESWSTAFRFLIKNVEADKPQAPEIQEKIEYFWSEIGVWTRWKPSHSSALLCIVREEAGSDKLWHDAWGSFNEQTQYPDLGMGQPFFWHAFIVSHVTKAFDDAVWSSRDRIRHVEQNRPHAIPNRRPNYQCMHEIARHVLHMVEVLEMSVTVVANMIKEGERFEGAAKAAKMDDSDCTQVFGILGCQKTLLECSYGRAKALNERLQNEINLAFHLGTERDSNNAALMAGSMQRDSIAMKTISVLGLVFLPGTFISSIFGMTFFDYTSTSEGWNVSSKFWIYWVVTIPVTLATWAVWQFLTRREMP